MAWLAAATHSGWGWLPGAELTWWIAIAWVAIVVVYGLYRSTGEAEQDTIRPSGPLP